MEKGQVINMGDWKRRKAQELEAAKIPPGFDPVLKIQQFLESLEQDADHFRELLAIARYPGEIQTITSKLRIIDGEIEETRAMIEGGDLSRESVFEFLKSRKVHHST